MRTRSQQYAEQVYQLVVDLHDLELDPLDKKEKEEDRVKRKRNVEKRYGSLCHSFPLIVRENGLAAAFGFLAAKGGSKAQSPESILLVHYAKMLGFSDSGQSLNSDNMREKVVSASLAEYRHLTQKTLILAEWFKRYAEGVLKVDATGAGEEENND